MMHQSSESNGNLPRNYLQFHENAFVSPLNLINVTHPAPISFGRAPHLLQQTIPRMDPSLSTASSIPHLQSVDTNKLHMYQFLAQRKLKEDRWKQELNEKNSLKQTYQRRGIRSAQGHQQPPAQQQHSKKPSARSTSAPKKSFVTRRDVNRSSQMTPPPIHFTRANDPQTALSMGKQNEIADIHEQLLAQLRALHNPSARENIIDETEQEKQRRIRLKRERIKRDSRAIYNAHQELKQIMNEIYQSEANFPRLIHRHLNAYKAILLAVETLANEAPLKTQDAPVQQLFSALLPVLETLTHTNQAFGLSQLQIDPSYFRHPPSKVSQPRPTSETRSSPANHLLPSIYQELMKKKQRKPRVIPSVLRPRSAESVRLPRTGTGHISRPTIAMQQKTRARSHSPLPSIRSASTIETPFYSPYTVDHILVKLAPRLLANYTGRELTDQIERARTLIPMFLVDNRLSDDDIVGRVIQMLMPRQQQAAPAPTHLEIFETPEERARRVDIDVYHTQISTWEDEMSQIRQRLQNYKTNRLEDDTTTRRTVKFRIDSPPRPTILPENVQIHHPLFEVPMDELVRQSVEHQPAFVQTSTRGQLRLQSLDSHKIRQIERYRKDYQSYLNRTESARSDEFDPCQVINRLSEFLLDEALLTVVNEVELLTVELSQKLVENELLGREISLADVEKQQQQYRRPAQSNTRKRSPISPSPPPNEQYNTSSFEEDLQTESNKVSRSEGEESPPPPSRKPNMGGTGRFTTAAFTHEKLPRKRSTSSSSASTISPPSPKGIIIKPTIAVKKPSSTHEEDHQYSDQDFESSASSKSKGRQQPVRRQWSDEEDEDDDLLLSTKTGEKIYSTDFEESRSKRRNVGRDDDDDDDEDDIADTMKLSARSVTTLQRSSSESDDS